MAKHRGSAAAKTARKRHGRAQDRIARVLVLADGDKPEVTDLIHELEPWIESRVERCTIEADVRAFYKRKLVKQKHASAPPDLMIVLGGDGAILAAVRAFADDPVPTLGINFGRVGFLASAQSAHWREALTEIFEGRAIVEPRMRIEADLFAENGERATVVALNDVVVTRGAYQGMLTLALKVGADWVTNYRADGLIVATPSGSTAYSLAAGGPILAPAMQGLVVTPICPQALSHRSIVLSADSELSLTVSESSGLTTLVVDGQGFYTMKQGDSVRLKRHPVPYPLLAQRELDPYKRLRDRLGWRGSFEPDVFPVDAPQVKREVDAGEGGVL